ncbi:uncharacterized protein CEXT_224041 [Caerostris extrusa]|uniref:Uncharacterized protein n=1 Tax=Caerostris extrusa TaxID=172846 RepID=A0AAV4NBW0_CAEEX|nr:uncharacterized protein CEXT_224041 [Caerostris extrusa]
MFNHMPYSSPAASQHSNYFSNAPIPQPTVPRFPIKDMFQGAFSQYPSKPSFLNKIKPYLFGNTGPRSLPHDPYYPNIFSSSPIHSKWPYHNRPPALSFLSVSSNAPFSCHDETRKSPVLALCMLDS